MSISGVLFGRDGRHQSLSTSGSRSDIKCDFVRAEVGKICPRRRRGGCLSPTFTLTHGLPLKPISSSSRPREPLDTWLSAFNRDIFVSLGALAEVESELKDKRTQANERYRGLALNRQANNFQFRVSDTTGRIISFKRPLLNRIVIGRPLRKEWPNCEVSRFTLHQGFRRHT